ncbi:MAG: GNAT family N-acetyltransferase [Saccharofermentanales bacterium]
MPNKRKRYDEEFKRRAVRLSYGSERTVREVSESLGIHENVLFLMIEEVSEKTIHLAAMIHSLSWQASHQSFCSEEFVSAHTPEMQKKYLRKIINDGAIIYMLISKGKPVGIISVNKSLIENLYILPSEQHNGYGTTLLKHAISKCEGKPTLWVLNNNSAIGFYEKHGFTATGNVHRLSYDLTEIEFYLHTSCVGLIDHI